MRWCCVTLVVLAGCASLWERHHERLAEYESRREYSQAAAEMQWLIDNAFYHAPARERTASAEAVRYIHLAQLAAEAGELPLAVHALREALTTDPSKAARIRAQLDKLPVSAAERERLKREFAWNSAALAPSGDSYLAPEAEGAACWSYRVREVRIRQHRTVSTPAGRQRQVTYDARAWAFEAESGQWQPDGDWMSAVGTETEMVNGTEQPRYRAVTIAAHQFYAEGTVPPCHRAAWRGPFDPAGRVFVAARLPARASAPSH